MEPAENQIDLEQGRPTEGSPESAARPLPIVLRVPWFSQETSTSAVASAATDAMPPDEASEPAATDTPAPAWRASASPRRRWPVLAALAGCLCAVAIGAVVDEFWWSRPQTSRPQVRRAGVIKNQTASPTTTPASEIEPLLAIPSAPQPDTTATAAVRVPAVTLAPEIIPLDSEEEP
jgi:hypothetical protein